MFSISCLGSGCGKDHRLTTVPFFGWYPSPGILCTPQPAHQLLLIVITDYFLMVAPDFEAAPPSLSLQLKPTDESAVLSQLATKMVEPQWEGLSRNGTARRASTNRLLAYLRNPGLRHRGVNSRVTLSILNFAQAPVSSVWTFLSHREVYYGHFRALEKLTSTCNAVFQVKSVFQTVKPYTVKTGYKQGISVSKIIGISKYFGATERFDTKLLRNLT
jgi:hypothetical protein